MNSKSKNNIKTQQLILGDLIFLIMITILCLQTYLFYYFILLDLPLIIKLIGTLISFYVSLCVMALLIPKVKPGLYNMKDRAVSLWFIGFVFGRIWHYPFIQYPIFNSVILRTLFLKCLGCKITFNSAISSDISIYDPHLIDIGQNVVIGMKSTIVPHFIVGGRLCLGQITVGKGSLIGAGAEIAGGTIIGSNVRIDVKCLLMPNSKILDNMRIKNNVIISKSDKFQENEVVPSFYQTKM